MGSGAAGMYETAMVAILVSAMGALIRAYGGFDALLYGVKKVFRGRKGGQLGMACWWAPWTWPPPTTPWPS